MMMITKGTPNILKYKTSYTDIEMNLLSRNKKIIVPEPKPVDAAKIEIKERKKT